MFPLPFLPYTHKGSHIITTTGKTALFETYISLEDFSRIVDRPWGFGNFGFATIIFFYRTRTSALLLTPNLEDKISVFMSPVRGCLSYTSRHYPPATTLWVTVEIFETASTWEGLHIHIRKNISLNVT
jgi:hypothetical protein